MSRLSLPVGLPLPWSGSPKNHLLAVVVGLNKRADCFTSSYSLHPWTGGRP